LKDLSHPPLTSINGRHQGIGQHRDLTGERVDLANSCDNFGADSVQRFLSGTCRACWSGSNPREQEGAEEAEEEEEEWNQGYVTLHCDRSFACCLLFFDRVFFSL